MGEIDVRDEQGIIFASARTGLVRKGFAEELCRRIEERAEPHEGRAALVMDMDALSKATPPAAAYAIRRMGEIPLEHIAIVGGNPPMRAMGRFVLTVGGFPSFGFFRDRTDAVAWVRAVQRSDAPSTRSRAGVIAKGASAAAAAVAAVLLVRRSVSRSRDEA